MNTGKGFGWQWLFLIALLGVVSCKKDRRDILFPLGYPPPPVQFDILPGLNTFDTHIYTLSPVPTGFSERLTASGFSRSDVKSIEPFRAFLTTTFGDVNLDFIHRISVQVYDPFNPGDRIEIFYLDPVPFRSKTGIQLFPGIANVMDWFSEDFMGIEIRLDFRNVSPTLMQMRLEFDMRAYSE